MAYEKVCFVCFQDISSLISTLTDNPDDPNYGNKLKWNNNNKPDNFNRVECFVSI